MNLPKKLKCTHCGTIVECKNGICQLTCGCGKVKVNGQFIIEGQIGKDYIDISPQLLQE